MSLHKCAYCGKVLEEGQGVVVERFGRNDYYCPEHKGLRNSLDKSFQVVKYIIGEPFLPLDCRKLLKVSLELLDVDKAYTYLAHSRDYWKDRFDKKDMNGDFNNIQAKVKYLLGILKNKLPSYQMPQSREIEGIIPEPYKGAEFKRESNRNKLERLLDKSK